MLRRLRQEILEKIGAQKRPTYDDFRDMKFLRAVINGALCYRPPPYRLSFKFLPLDSGTETLRLYPVVYVVWFFSPSLYLYIILIYCYHLSPFNVRYSRPPILSWISSYFVNQNIK